jgi:MerR family mercuric resistance operon transcriptional regulator
MEQRITIGKVAAAAEVNVETIRFYHRRGLVIEPEKEPGGFRYYDDKAIAQVRFIKQAQALGFSLNEIKGLMVLNEPGSCERTHDVAVAKLSLVETKIAELQAMRKTLKRLVQECEVRKDDTNCPIIESLDDAALNAKARQTQSNSQRTPR